jgi:hypothetical protein
MRLIALGTPSIWEPTRCIRIWRRISGGLEWREKLRSMYRNVTHVEGSKPITWGHLEIYNRWAFMSVSEKTSAWISLWVCPAPRVGTTQYGSLLTAWLSQSTLYPYPPLIESASTPSSTYHILSAIMPCRRPSSLIEDQSLWLASRSNCMSVCAPISFEAQPIILRLMDKLSESIKLSKI